MRCFWELLYKVSRCEQNLSLKYFEYLLKVTYTDLFVKTNFSLMNGKIIKVTCGLQCICNSQTGSDFSVHQLFCLFYHSKSIY